MRIKFYVQFNPADCPTIPESLFTFSGCSLAVAYSKLINKLLEKKILSYVRLIQVLSKDGRG
jgi:NifU-like protein involved in Fe-S cluster formation